MSLTDMDQARREILKKLQDHPYGKSEAEKPDFSSSLYPPLGNDLSLQFKTKLESLGGEVHLCENEQYLYGQLKQLVTKNWVNVYCKEPALIETLKNYQVPVKECEIIPNDIEAGITGCEALVAHLGSVMVTSAQESGRQLFVYPPVHIVIASEKQLVGYLHEAYNHITEKYGSSLPSLITNITGPSRTADIEKTLIMGMHGPKELHVFISK